MDAHSLHPIYNLQQVQTGLQTCLPHYNCEVRHNKMVMVAKNPWTGVALKVTGPNSVSMGWGIPSTGLLIFMTIFMVLTGIIPGLILFGLMYLVAKGAVKSMQQEVASVLAGSVPAGVAGYSQAQLGVAPPQAQPGFAPPQAQPGFAPPQAQPGFAQPQAQPGFAQPQAQPGFAPPQAQPDPGQNS